MATRIKEPSLANLPPLEEYAEQLDFERITAAIVGPPGTPAIPEYDLEDIKNMIWLAAEKWLARDIYDMEILGVEEEFLSPVQVPYGTQEIRGFKDVTGTLHGRLNATKKHAGKKVVIDWKSTRVTLDKIWDQRLLDSWQWRNYLYFDDAEVMIFRGFNRHGDTRELLIERPAGLQQDVLTQIAGVAVQRESLITSGLDIWPRNKPSACGAYGRECPYIGDCDEGTMPRAAVLPGRSFSYSSMGRFLSCPERYRRGLFEAHGEDTEESLTGQAIHRGLAELYLQAKKFQV